MIQRDGGKVRFRNIESTIASSPHKKSSVNKRVEIVSPITMLREKKAYG